MTSTRERSLGAVGRAAVVPSASGSTRRGGPSLEPSGGAPREIHTARSGSHEGESKRTPGPTGGRRWRHLCRMSLEPVADGGRRLGPQCSAESLEIDDTPRHERSPTPPRRTPAPATHTCAPPRTVGISVRPSDHGDHHATFTATPRADARCARMAQVPWTRGAPPRGRDRTRSWVRVMARRLRPVALWVATALSIDDDGGAAVGCHGLSWRWPTGGRTRRRARGVPCWRRLSTTSRA